MKKRWLAAFAIGFSLSVLFHVIAALTRRALWAILQAPGLMLAWQFYGANRIALTTFMVIGNGVCYGLVFLELSMLIEWVRDRRSGV